MFHNIMIDFETLSLQTNAAIIEVGAVPFNTVNDAVHGRASLVPEEWVSAPVSYFNKRVWPGSYPKEGYDVSESTMEFWSKQDEATRKLVFSGMEDITQVATAFREWLETYQGLGLLAPQGTLKWWSRNILFDMPVMKNWLEIEGVPYPPFYRNHRDVYQALDDIPEDVRKTFTVNPCWHVAIVDAHTQARNVCEADHFNRFGSKLEWK